MLFFSVNVSAAEMLQITSQFYLDDETSTEQPAAGPVLQTGSRGDAVLVLQKALALTGFYHGEFDGVFGADTEKAVKAAQIAHGFQANGQVTAEFAMLLRDMSQSVSRGMRTMQMNVSAYSSADPGCGLYTYRGTRLRKGLCAVDPTVIPLGTRLYVPGYGIAIADDIGSAIKGARLDLAFESRYEALNFGRKSLTVFILD